jgi:hypothetical protein
MDAWVAGDGDGVVALIGDPARNHYGSLNQVNIGAVQNVDTPDLYSMPWDVAALPALHDWFRSLGWEFRREPCQLYAYAGNRAPWTQADVPDLLGVECHYTYENDITRAVGRAPVTDRFVLYVVGDKVARFDDGGMFDLDADIWQMFSDWVRSAHADDFAAMYYPNTAPLAPRLDEASIALWDRHVEEFVTSPEAHTPAPGPPTRAQFGAKARMICATANFEQWALRRWGPSPSPAALAQASQSAMEQLRALPRPNEDTAQIDRLFSLLEEIHRSVVLDVWFHQIDHLIAEKDALGGRDFWGCPVLLGG